MPSPWKAYLCGIGPAILIEASIIRAAAHEGSATVWIVCILSQIKKFKNAGQEFCLPNLGEQPRTTNFMEKYPSWEAKNLSSTHEILCLLWSPIGHYRVHKSPPLVPTLRQINQVRICHLLACWFLLNYFFDPEDGGDMFLRNVGFNSTDYTASYLFSYIGTGIGQSVLRPASRPGFDFL
jgi:hypothetical protein